MKGWSSPSRHATGEDGRSPPSAQPSKLLTQVSELLQVSELQQLSTTFGYLVAKQGATAVLGLAYWAVATRLFSARDVGLAAAASSAALFPRSDRCSGIHSSCWPN